MHRMHKNQGFFYIAQGLHSIGGMLYFLYKAERTIVHIKYQGQRKERRRIKMTMDEKLDIILLEIKDVKQEMGSVKQEMGNLKQEIDGLKHR